MTDSDRTADLANSDRAHACGTITSDNRSLEPELSSMRWPGHGYLSAVELTREFARRYLEVYRTFWDRRGDPSNPGKHQAPLREHNLFENNPRVLTGLWRARMAADGMGLPYEIYLNAAFEFLIGRGYRRLPQPNQLYSDPVLDHIRQISGHLQLGQLIPAHVSDVRFLARNYRGDPPQDALHEVLFGILRGMQGAALRDALKDLIQDRQLLPEAKAREVLGDKVCDECLGTSPAHELPPQGDLAPFRPGCFGLPGALNPSSAVCGECPFVAACQSAVEEAEELTVEIFGSVNPRVERTKEQNRVSKRKQRPPKGQNRVA